MSETQRLRIGQKVHDETTARDGVLTDVRRSGVHTVRPLHGIGGEWDAEDPERLVPLGPYAGPQ